MSRIGRFAASPEEREKGANVSTGKVLKNNGVIDACGERENPIHNMIVGVVLGARLKWLGFWLSRGMTRYTHNMTSLTYLPNITTYIQGVFFTGTPLKS